MPEAGRVIAGSARGIRLLSVGEGTRPLGDRVKETLFAILQAGSLADWPQPFLDLFAGSGAGGIEALSRGAPAAVFVERDAKAARIIGENLRRAGFGETDTARVVVADVLRHLQAGPGGQRFGAVLVDPPYEDAAMLPALERLSSAGWLLDGAVVVAKHHWRDQPPERVGRLERRRERRFGETMLSFYVTLDPDAPPSRDQASRSQDAP